MTHRDDTRMLACIERHGKTGTSFQALGRDVLHWFDADHGRTRGAIAYFDTGAAWVVAGEPIASPADCIAVAESFLTHALQAGTRVCFFATEGVLASSPRFRRIQIGEQPVWDPSEWDDHMRAHRSMREQLRRATAKGVRVRRLSVNDVDAGSALRRALDALIARWHASRVMAPMHFMVAMTPFDFAEHRQLWVAERDGDAVALLSMAPVPARAGWLFEHLLRDPSAPNGCAELLVDVAMRSLAAADVHWVTLGLAPLSGDVTPWLRTVRRWARPLFNFDGLAAFKRKLRPRHWEPIYLAFPRDGNSAIAVIDALRAFAGGSLWRFGLASMLHGSPLLLGVLFWLLIPWTMVLAMAPTRPWFPSSAVHWGWVSFDAGLLIVLWAWRIATRRDAKGGDASRTLTKDSIHALTTVLAIAVSLDALLTTIEAIWWNAPRTHSVALAVALVIACTGPWMAAPVLWGTVRRTRRLRFGHERRFTGSR